MRRIVKFLLRVVGFIMLLFSLFELFLYLNKNNFFEIILGIIALNKEPNKIIELSANKNKYMGKKATSTMDEFIDMLKKRGYKFIARYGKADIYEVNGLEILVKRTIILNRYYIFDIFDEKNSLA